MTTNEKRCNKSVSSRSSSSLFARKKLAQSTFTLCDELNQNALLSHSSKVVLVKKMEFVEKKLRSLCSPLKNLAQISVIISHRKKALFVYESL